MGKAVTNQLESLSDQVQYTMVSISKIAQNKAY